jgi:hypothetical protein
MEQREKANIESVRLWCKSAHVEDSDALEAYATGRGIFDVSDGAVKLAKFVAQHPEVKRTVLTAHGDFPSVNVPGRDPVYFAFGQG